MRKTIEVVDDFYRKPMAVRQLALQDAAGVHDDPLVASFTRDEADARLLRLLGRAPDTATVVSSRFEVLENGAQERIFGTSADWMAIVFLPPPADCHGGIGFYRQVPQPDGTSSRDEVMFVPTTFNRMVLFQPGQPTDPVSLEFDAVPGQGPLAQILYLTDDPAK